MPTNDEHREMLERPDLSDKEVDEFRRDLQAFISQFLDHYFRKEFEPDEGYRE